jgi:hypothetical protein
MERLISGYKLALYQGDDSIESVKGNQNTEVRPELHNGRKQNITTNKKWINVKI